MLASQLRIPCKACGFAEVAPSEENPAPVPDWCSLDPAGADTTFLTESTLTHLEWAFARCCGVNIFMQLI